MSAAFWDWSLERYDREGVASALLDLQDNFGLNVNVLLWCAWCAQDFADIPELALRKAVDLAEHWTTGVTGPLRQARRALKAPPRQADAQEAQALRSEIKSLELRAEKIEQEMLAALARDALDLAGGGAAAGRARRNLARYIALTGAQKRPGFSVLMIDGLAERLYPAADATAGAQE